MSEGRDIYHEPSDVVLLRTPDVYQTVADDDTDCYSDKLLSMVANLEYAGIPESTNARSMVGKSKRGEIACKLFARIDPQTKIIEAAGFQVRGSLAMVGCASAACDLMTNRTIEEALAISEQDIRTAIDDVPPGRAETVTFAEEAIRALVGDFLLNEGYSLAQLDEQVPCEPYSIPCILCEHCSLRDGRIEKHCAEINDEQLAEQPDEEIDEQLAEHNALAKVFDMVRDDSSNSLLSTPQRWVEAGLVPAHLTAEDLEMSVFDYLCQWEKDHPEATASDQPSKQQAKDPVSPKPSSAFASKAVGIPPFLRSSSVQEEEKVDEPLVKRAIPVEENASSDNELNIPEGYKLKQIEGEWVLVETEEPAEPKPLEIKPEGIKMLVGEKGYYLFDQSLMTSSYAHWAFLAAEDNPLVTLSDCVREESRVYPRPMPAVNLGNEPFNMSVPEVEQTFSQIASRVGYEDIQRIEASNGDVYFFSSTYLTPAQAQALAEWDAVERYLNV